MNKLKIKWIKLFWHLINKFKLKQILWEDKYIMGFFNLLKLYYQKEIVNQIYIMENKRVILFVLIYKRN
jgi:hypothetical protein